MIEYTSIGKLFHELNESEKKDVLKSTDPGEIEYIIKNNIKIITAEELKKHDVKFTDNFIMFCTTKLYNSNIGEFYEYNVKTNQLYIWNCGKYDSIRPKIKKDEFGRFYITYNYKGKKYFGTDIIFDSYMKKMEVKTC